MRGKAGLRRIRAAILEGGPCNDLIVKLLAEKAGYELFSSYPLIINHLIALIFLSTSQFM